MLDWTLRAVGEAKYYHLDPVALRQPSRIASSKPFEMSADGTGFPTFLEDMLRADRQAFFKTEEAFYQRFPQYTIDVPKDISPNGAMNVLKLKTKNGQSLTSQEVSDGALLYLAYLAISHQPNPPGVLLVEEPENGVHHSGLKQIIEALASLSKTRGIQVILTTHSPYLLDFVEPENVQVFLKDSEGAVHATKMSDSAQVKDLQKDFMTGEIWTVLSEEGLAGKTQVKP
jgi:predicted ATPase